MESLFVLFNGSFPFRAVTSLLVFLWLYLSTISVRDAPHGYLLLRAAFFPTGAAAIHPIAGLLSKNPMMPLRAGKQLPVLELFHRCISSFGFKSYDSLFPFF